MIDERDEFDIVVTRDQTRLGGDTSRLMRVVEDLIDDKKRIWYYATKHEVSLGNWKDKIFFAIEAGASEGERDAISARTREDLFVKARDGSRCVGGAVYGYTLVPEMVLSKKVKTTYAINEAEAEVIRELYRRYANGEGLKSLAKDLNRRAVPSPLAGKRSTGFWCPSSIRPMLLRPRYRGLIVYGVTEKTYKGGTKVRVVRDETARQQVEVPHLRIVDEELWQAVENKFMGHRRLTGKRGPKGPPAVHLLSGLGKCSICGGRSTRRTANRALTW